MVAMCKWNGNRRRLDDDAANKKESINENKTICFQGLNFKALYREKKIYSDEIAKGRDFHCLKRLGKDESFFF